jgi:CheY-like chemotaxis protein
MTRLRRRVTVLVADGDAEGRRLMGEAFAARWPDCDLRFAGDGEQLLNYLCRRGPYRDPACSCSTGICQARAGWSRSGRYGPPPVVVLGPSKAGGDVARAYDLDAASFILKPTTPEGMAGVIEALGKSWLDVELPDADKGDADGPPPR